MIIKFLLLLVLFTPLAFSSDEVNVDGIKVWKDLKDIEPLKAVWDFNFENPKDLHRALNPIVLAINANSEHGPLSFDQMDNVVVSHGAEAVVWAKKNYSVFSDTIDRARRMVEMGVRFEVCNVVAAAQGFSPEDFYDFIDIVPTGSYAIIYWSSKGYSIVPAGATQPVRPVNEFNDRYTGQF